MTAYLGIDWGEQKHQRCFMNEAGAVIQQLSVDHSVEGFLKLETICQSLGTSPAEIVIGLETAHNLLIDLLVERSYPAIYILPPSQVKSNAGRYAQSGAKDDLRDAWVIADMLRTDRGRFHAWQADTLLTRQIQAQVRLVLFLTRTIQRQSNHLRAILVRYYPAMLDLFSRLDSPTTLAFLAAYPIPQVARQLTYDQFTIIPIGGNGRPCINNSTILTRRRTQIRSPCWRPKPNNALYYSSPFFKPRRMPWQNCKSSTGNTRMEPFMTNSRGWGIPWRPHYWQNSGMTGYVFLPARCYRPLQGLARLPGDREKAS
jgi:hypothetical protein